MYEIKAMPIRKFELVDIPMVEDQLIYCIDSKEAFYDLKSQVRIQLGCTIQLDTERDRIQLVEPLEDKIYIVKEENMLYMYYSHDWHPITNRSEVIDLIVPADLLVPTTLRKQGINLAPKTLASEVLTADGRQLQNILDEMLSDNKKILLYTKTIIIEVERDGQRVFNIPYPVENYDIEKFPILIFLNNNWIPGSNYMISIDQLIFNESFDFLRKGDLLTFVFNYNVTISPDDTIDATSINGIRIYAGPFEPADKMEGDVWFDTTEKAVKQFNGTEWEVIVKNKDFKIDIIKSTYTLSGTSSTIPIGIDGFNKDTDLIQVFENATYKEELSDYTISEDNQFIINNDKGEWLGNDEEIVFNFIVFKNIKGNPEEEIKTRMFSNTSYKANKKQELLKTLGLDERDLLTIKSLSKGV